MPVILSDYTKQIKKIECVGATMSEFRTEEFKRYNRVPDIEYDFPGNVAFKRLNDYVLLPLFSQGTFDVTIYVISSANHYYTFFIKDDSLYLSRLSYHDERDPYPEDLWEIYPYSKKYRRKDEEKGYDKNLIDEFWAIIDIENKTYSLGSHRHVLCGGSGHGAITRITPEVVGAWEPKEGEDEVKAILMIAKTTIEELKEIEGIETILDFKILDIIPGPNPSSMKKVPKRENKKAKKTR